MEYQEKHPEKLYGSVYLNNREADCSKPDLCPNVSLGVKDKLSKHVCYIVDHLTLKIP